jgi:catechol 2,3-dioxygenase-like lactoylglutathione lyase family enzyme
MVVPVSDVDQAKRFYQRLGWRFDAEAAVEEGYRLVQFTPLGPPQGLHLAAYDIQRDRADLLGRGFGVGGPFQDATSVFRRKKREELRKP